ncbi:MAG: DUF4230 domain-containing protein [Planctomycetota bacterium]
MTTRRTLPILLILLFATTAGALFTLLWLRSEKTPVSVFSSGPTVTNLRRLGELVTTRVHVADVLTAEDQKYRGFWLIKGDALIAVDMLQARVESRNDETHSATVVLPPPRVIQARVDHEKTRTWDVQRKTWNPFKPGDPDLLRDEAMRHAQQLVEFAAGEPDSLSYARKIAETLIPSFFEMVGWQVSVRWSDSP